MPYRGAAPALIDLIGGHVQVEFDPIPGSIEYIRAGKLRALAVTTAARTRPPLGCRATPLRVPGYEASAFFGVGAPRNTPSEILKARFADLGGAALAGSPADFGKLIAEEAEKWGKVIRAAHIKPD